MGKANSLEDKPLRAAALHSQAVILVARGGGQTEDGSQLWVERMVGPVPSTVSPSEPLASRRAAATVWELDGFNRMLSPCPAPSLLGACGPLPFLRLQHI